MSGPPPAGPPPEDDFDDSGDDAVAHGFANQLASGQIGGLDEAVAASEDGFGETESKVDDEVDDDVFDQGDSGAENDGDMFPGGLTVGAGRAPSEADATSEAGEGGYSAMLNRGGRAYTQNRRGTQERQNLQRKYLTNPRVTRGELRLYVKWLNSLRIWTSPGVDPAHAVVAPHEQMCSGLLLLESCVTSANAAVRPSALPLWLTIGHKHGRW